MEPVMTAKSARRPRVGLLVAAALALAGAAAAEVWAPPARAQASLAAEKAVVDAAKARGEVGEQPDGFLGLVSGGALQGVTAAVDRINAGRREAYAAAASTTGVSVDVAAAAAGRQLIARTPPGQYYRTADGAWVRK
jgi:uncharacterized protein YdbL (DUF1318 family)